MKIGNNPKVVIVIVAVLGLMIGGSEIGRAHV